MAKKNILVKIAYFAFLAFYLFIAIYSISRSEIYYIFDSILFILTATLFYLFYEKLNMNPFSFLIINMVMGLHELGRFGFFGMQFFGINYDLIMHFFSCFAISNILYFALKPRISSKEKNFRRLFPIIIVLLCLGIACLGEFMEFAGFLYIENGQGFMGVEPEKVSKELIGVDPSTYEKNLTIENEITCETMEQQLALKLSGEMYDSYYDTLTDLLSNALGAIVSLIFLEGYLKFKSIKNKKISKKKRK